MKFFLFLFLLFEFLSPVTSKANEINIDGLSEYSSTESQKNNFSDVIPTDWAFSALNKLAENRDCNFITRKSDSVSSRKIFTRHEAALIIKNCLNTATKTNQEEKRLLDEFDIEIKSIKSLFNENHLD